MLKTDLCGIKLVNPFILASGVLGVNASIMVRIANAGCGAITTKSIGFEPKEGYVNPTVVELGEGSLLNAMGLPNPGCNEFINEIVEYRKRTKTPIIVSIFGKNIEEFIHVAQIISKAHPDAIELNVSCPHGGKYGAIVGQDNELVGNITYEVKKEVKSASVFVKISPNLTDILLPVEAAIENGADGIVAINTVRAMAIDIKYRKPILSNKFGGLSGSAIKPITLKCIYDIYSKFGKRVPIIGVGGITKWEDVIEFLLAGATAIQIGTTIAYYGDPKNITIFNDFSRGVTNYLHDENFKKINELVGLAHEL